MRLIRWIHNLRLLSVAISLALAASSAWAGTTVRMMTTLGVVDLGLYDASAPLNAANFLGYVSSGAFSNTLIHRSVPKFVIQGGGYAWVDAINGVNAIATSAPVKGEYSDTRPNARGTIAMATTGDPNSATSQWFINLADNSSVLNQSNNGGYTVFGKVIGAGMNVVDAIAALPTGNAGGAFATLPLATTPVGGSIQKANVVLVTSVSAIAEGSTSDSDRIFAYLEGSYPQYLAPANPVSNPASRSSSAAGYYYRYYASTNAYIATANGNLYYYGPLTGSKEITLLGTLAEWLNAAVAAGY